MDCIIFASGFEVTSTIERRIGIARFEGRDGLSLYDHWRDGFKTLHGITSCGFPNIFFVGAYQGGTSPVVPLIYNTQMHIVHILQAAQDRSAAANEPSQEAQDDWIWTMREHELPMAAFFDAYTPGYYNNEGSSVRH